VKIISIDPGVMTGYCYATLDEKEHVLKYHPFQIVDDVDDMWRRLHYFSPRFIIIEDFEFRRGKQATGGLVLFPVQMIGVARLFELVAPKCTTFLQKAAQGKAYYSDKTLKHLGLYKRGLPHAMDASRHLLQWCMFGYGNQFIGSSSTEDFASFEEDMDWWRNGL
jgi:hypothetical protein